MSGVPIIGRGCCSAPWFTRRIAETLGLPELRREPGETDERFLIRRLAQIQFCNRHWVRADLGALSPDLLALAAMQICAAAADYCQDRLAEQESLRAEADETIYRRAPIASQENESP